MLEWVTNRLRVNMSMNTEARKKGHVMVQHMKLPFLSCVCTAPSREQGNTLRNFVRVKTVLDREETIGNYCGRGRWINKIGCMHMSI